MSHINTDSLSWNLPVFPSAGKIQESWFFKVNDDRTGQAVWIKFTAICPGPGEERLYEVWAMYFPAWGKGRFESVLAIKNEFPESEIKIVQSMSWCEVRFGKNLFQQKENGMIKSQGSISNDQGVSASWEIEFRGNSKLEHFPKPFMYTSAFPKRKLVSPFFDAKADGYFKIAYGAGSKSVKKSTGKKITAKKTSKIVFKKAPAMEGHNWGTEHSHRYVWCHGNNFFEERTGERAVFEGFSGKIKIGPLVTPYMTGLYMEIPDTGEENTINLLALKNYFNRSVRVDFKKFSWTWKAKKDDILVEGIFYADRTCTAGLRYSDPDGKMNYCYNSKVAHGEILIRNAQNGTILRRYVSRGGCALEFLTDELYKDLVLV